MSDKLLESLIESTGAVLIEGAKWCGKTQSSIQKANSVVYMQDPDEGPEYLTMVDTKPSLLLDMEAFINQLHILVNLAEEKHKPAALTETGCLDRVGSATMADEDRFTTVLLRGVLADDITKKISYVMVWRNDNPDHFHVPYPRHPAVKDFLEFYNDSLIYFMSDINLMEK